MEVLPDLPQEFIGPIVPCLNFLTNSGLMIYEKPRGFFMKYCLPIFSLCCVTSYHTSLTMYMFKVFKGDLQLDELAYVVSVYVICTQAILKAMVVGLNKKEIRSVITQLGGLWTTEGFTELQINKKNALLKRLKFCYAVFYWMNIIGSWQYILAPLLETVFRRYVLQQECGLLFPFSCSFPFDPTGNWLRYICVYIFETYSKYKMKKKKITFHHLVDTDLPRPLFTPLPRKGYVSHAYLVCMFLCLYNGGILAINNLFRIVYFYLGTEFLMITLCSHLATEFTLLREDLVNIKPVINSDSTSWENLRIFKNVISKHQKLISLAQKLDDIFNKVIFVNLTSASITICFFGFGAKVARGALDMVNNFIAVVCLIYPLFNLCYYCELLSEASAGMADSAYNSLWYQGDLSYQKLMWLVIRRSQKPCSLTSMKYNPIDLKTFTTVLSTTWSYFSLASSLYEDES